METCGYALDTTWRTLLKDMGVSSANVLRRAGLPEDLLSQPSVRLESKEYYSLWDSIEAEAGDALLPIAICNAIRSESFSPLLFAALCSSNLLVAGQRIARYKSLIAPIRLDVSRSGDVATFAFTWLDGPLVPPVSLVLMELLFCVTLARIGTREAIRPLEVTTTVLPTPASPYESFVGARLQRGERHLVKFTAVDATRPFLTSNASMWAAFEPDLRQRLADLEAGASTTARVRAVLLEELPGGLAPMEEIARRLALSKRTLQRRIEAEGTSYQQIVNETRKSLAQHYLENTALPIAEVSCLLGFEEANSFYRAFKAWTGATPDQARRVPLAGHGVKGGAAAGSA
jgi:AraC-like DNA-binding protein